MELTPPQPYTPPPLPALTIAAGAGGTPSPPALYTHTPLTIGAGQAVPLLPHLVQLLLALHCQVVHALLVGQVLLLARRQLHALKQVPEGGAGEAGVGAGGRWGEGLVRRV
jgi:hypothetical protein